MINEAIDRLPDPVEASFELAIVADDESALSPQEIALNAPESQEGEFRRPRQARSLNARATDSDPELTATIGTAEEERGSAHGTARTAEERVGAVKQRVYATDETATCTAESAFGESLEHTIAARICQN
jgi:hypothetical protein